MLLLYESNGIIVNVQIYRIGVTNYSVKKKDQVDALLWLIRLLKELTVDQIRFVKRPWS